MRNILASLREFGSKVGRRWYALAVGVIGGVIGLASTLYAQANPKAAPLVPVWSWLALLAGGFLVAIIWAFHDVRMERDNALAEIERRFSAMRYALEFQGADAVTDPAGDGTGGVQVTIRLLNSSEEFLRYEVEDITVEVEGRRAPDKAQGSSQGRVLTPHGLGRYTAEAVRGVPIPWQKGELTFAIQYGQPAAPPRYRMIQWVGLEVRRRLNEPPGQLGEIVSLLGEPNVEDLRRSCRTSRQPGIP